MSRLVPLLEKLAFRIFQIGSVCLLSALLPSAGGASPYLTLGTIPRFISVHKLPPNFQKPKLPRQKIPDRLRMRFDDNFLKGLV